VSAFLRKKSQALPIPYFNHLSVSGSVSVACALFVSDNSGTSVIFSSPEGSPDSILLTSLSE
jgi:hypothetical protein